MQISYWKLACVIVGEQTPKFVQTRVKVTNTDSNDRLGTKIEISSVFVKSYRTGGAGAPLLRMEAYLLN